MRADTTLPPGEYLRAFKGNSDDPEEDLAENSPVPYGDEQDES
jgi:hypothetical protein